MGGVGLFRNASKRPILTFIMGAALVISVSIVTLRVLERRVIDTQLQLLYDVAQLKHRIIEKYLDERKGDAQVVAAIPLIQNILAGSDDADKRAAISDQLNIFTATLLKAYGYSKLAIFDLRDDLYVDVSGNVIPEVVRQVLDTLKEDPRVRLLDFNVSAEGRVFFGVVAPVVSKQDDKTVVIGAIYLEQDAAASILDEFEQWPNPSKTGEVYLVKSDGQTVKYLSRLLFQPSIKPLELERAAVDEFFTSSESAETQRTQKQGRDYRGVPVFAVTARVESMPWFVVAKIDRKEALQPVSNVQISASLIGGIILLLFAGLTSQSSKLEREKRARADAQSAARFATAMETMGDANAILDGNGRFVEWNKAASALFGRASLKGLSISSIFGGQVSSAFEDPHDIGRSHVFRKQIELKNVDNSLVDLDVTVARLPGDDVQHFFFTARDVSEMLRVGHRLARINQLYSFLVATNETVRTLADVQSILSAVCRMAVEQGNFSLVWAAAPDEKSGMAHPISAFGPASDYTRDIVVPLSPLQGEGLGPTARALREGRIEIVNEFMSDARTAPWHEIARKFGLRSSIALPIFVQGEPIVALMFYANTTNFFDEELVSLLEQICRTVSMACTAALMAQRAAAAEKEAEFQANRYEDVFDFSPIALMIISEGENGRIQINAAHQRLFGYSAEELRTLADWFNNMYPDPAFREEIEQAWNNDIQRARTTGLPVNSPLLELRAKNGAMRIVQGRVSAITGGMIVAWTDLTEREEQARALRQNEARFRGLIEQSIVGVYVLRGNRALYANPRFLEICGRTEEEVLGQDPRIFLAPESMPIVDEAAQALLNHNKVGADIDLVFVRPDGERRDVAVHVALSSWDGKIASISIVQDVSEQRRAQEKIEEYIRQLTASVEGTLMAVSKMLEIRDPYTAGHQQRVGAIAADLGREMGLNEERCRWLRWAGLVHDIGKISVPASVLSKPTRLTALEYEMIKVHAESGYEILKDIAFPAPVAEIARQHHERLDGTGYPQGLKGEEILLEARIVAVADVLESIASSRPYRPARGLDVALEELRKHRGTFYDPDVVDALERLIGGGKWVVPEYAVNDGYIRD